MFLIFININLVKGEVFLYGKNEDFVYSFSGEERPQQLNVKIKELFNEQAYKTN